MSDNELIKRIQQGDRQSADTLIERYYAPMLRYCARHCPDPDRAEDLTQELFLRLFRDIGRYRPEGSFKAYLYTIAYHLCMDELRKPPDFPLDETLCADGGELKRVEDRDEAERLLQRLSPEQREAVLLRCGEGLSFKDISKICGITVSTAKSRVRLALVNMRRAPK